jgi:hypothetical protein
MAGLFSFGDDANQNPALAEEQDVLDLFSEASQPEFKPEPLKLEDKVEVIVVTDNKPEEKPEEPKETTGDTEVDALLAELGLEGLDEFKPIEPTIDETPKAEEPPMGFVEGWGVYGPQEAPPQKEEKPKKPRKTSIPMDAPIPVRNYENLILGIYGNILDEREEPFPTSHKFAGMTYEERKLERFNPKAHEVFRNTKGNMHLVYTNVGATYLIVMKKPDGTLEPVLEVANKGRGHLRCKQIANALQVAYNEKNDQEVISAEVYGKLTEQIELLPINLPVAEVAEA